MAGDIADRGPVAKETADTLEKMLGTERWLMSVGLVPETVQQNLITYGLLSSENAINAEVDLDIKGKIAKYTIFLTSGKRVKEYQKYQAKLDKYSMSTSLLGKFLLLRLLKRRLHMDIEGNLKRFVRDYLPGFKVEFEVKSI